MDKLDLMILGYAVNQCSGGYDGKNYQFLKTIDAKYLYRSCFLDTYCAEPMAFMQLAAQVEAKGFSVKVFDGLVLEYTKEDLMRVLFENDSILYGFSIYESTQEDIFEIISWLKTIRPNAKIFVGGPYATIAVQHIMEFCSEVDYVMIGDGDNAICELIGCIKTQGKITDVTNIFYRDAQQKIHSTTIKYVDLNTLMPTKRLYSDIIQKRGYSFSISSSRGCGYANCAFCYLKEYQRVGKQPRFRFKKPQYVVNEIYELIKTFGITKLTFSDEDFFGDKAGIERAIEIFDLLIKRNIIIDLHVNARVQTVIWLAKNGYLDICSRAGVRYMYIGLESYNDESLSLFNKGITTKDIDFVVEELERYQIRINPGLITFDPTLSIEQVKRNIDLFKRIKYYDAFIFTRRLVLYPSASKKIRDLFLNPTYFCDANTRKLYEAMIRYRDAVFPYYIRLNKSLVVDKDIETIQEYHFQSFYKVYNTLQRGDDNYNYVIEGCIQKVCRYIEHLLT